MGIAIRDVEAVIFQPLPHLLLPLPHLSLPLPQTKNEKTTVDNFFNFCGSVACLLLHFIVLRRQKPIHILLLLQVLRLRLLFQTTVCFFFQILELVLNVEQRSSTFLPLRFQVMYFRVCHGIPTNKNLEITNCL